MLVAVATVLITPDTTDDVQGVLQRQTLSLSLAIVAIIFLPGFVQTAPTFTSDGASHSIPLTAVADLICVRLC